MLKVALTGGIATGKSHVLDYCRHRGVPCLDADALTHGVMAAETEATAAIARHFGESILAPDGSVDRSRLGPIVFADPVQRHALEAIVHPAVYRAIAAGLRAFERLDDPLFAVVDVPLLYESGRDRDFDRVIVTTCSVDQQIARLRHRGLTIEDARARIATQWPTEQKVARADFVIQTDGTLEHTDAQTADILALLDHRRS